jgi:hypothetical protein
MHRVALFVSVALTVACHRTSSSTSAGEGAGSATGSATADAKVPITDAMVDRYLGYNKDFRQAQTDWVRQSHGNLADLRADAAFGETLKRLRDKWNLSEPQVKALDGLFGQIGTSRLMWEKMGGKEQLAYLEKEQAKERAHPTKVDVPANAPPQMRGYAQNLEALQQGNVERMASAIDGLKRQRDLTDLRAQYGDEVIDYVLKNGGSALEPGSELAAAAHGQTTH